MRPERRRGRLWGRATVCIGLSPVRPGTSNPAAHRTAQPVGGFASFQVPTTGSNWAELPAEERNWGRLIFLSPATRDLFVDWHAKAAGVAGILRLHAGIHPDDPQLAQLVGELSVRSEEFRQLWAAHEVRRKGHGVLRFNHPLVGDLTLSYETFPLPDDPDQTFVTYHPEPGSPSPSAAALLLLASWGADATTRSF
ncbi:hypothetical protein AB0F43_10780 [Kribbella sp. NPDC023972]|uniref:MmyB family transcriptional regulator n=1 Tax=Kribbella sp. NPDC023972 TaxID=3154795 RepID=UPI0033CCE620